MNKYPIQARVLNEVLSLRGMTRAELARVTGLSPTAITYYCGGEKIMSLLNAAKIARALDISLEYLAAGETSHNATNERTVSEEEYSLVQAFRSWMEDTRIEPKMSRHLFLRGQSSAGKSYEIRKAVISHLDQIGGFYIQQVRDGDQIAGFVLNPVRDDYEYVLSKERDADNARRMFIFRQKNGWAFDGEIFERYGVKYLRDNLHRKTTLTVLDETGSLELLCKDFRALLYQTLDTTPCVGAIKSAANTQQIAGENRQFHDAIPVREQFLKILAARHNTKFLDMTEDNVEKTRHKLAQFVHSNLDPVVDNPWSGPDAFI